jgi:hypothetical protein
MGFGDGGHPVAKKTHPCIWCNEPIVIGERHFKYVGEWEGEFQNWRMHSDCLDAHQRETFDGEICDSAHQRGRTCEEKEAAQRKLAKDVNEVVADLLREKGVPGDVLDLIHRQNVGSIVVRDLFLESIYDEERRVQESRRKAIEAGKKKVRAS